MIHSHKRLILLNNLTDATMDEIKNAMDKQADSTEPSCSMAVFHSDMIHETEYE